MPYSITIIYTDNYILLSILSKDEKSLSWQEIQEIKQYYFSDLTFVEIYPSNNKVVNNVNQRHLWHLRDQNLPCLTDLGNLVGHTFVNANE